MKERWTNHIADFDTIELLAVDTETLDMDTDTLFTQSAEKYTLDIFSVCGKVGKEYVYGAFPKEMFLDFYKRNMWKRWIMHNAGYDLKVVRKLGLAWDQIKIEDTMVMAQLLGYTKWGYGLKDLRVSELGLAKRKGYEDIDRNNKKEYYTYAALDTLDTYKLYEKLLVRLEEEELLEAYAIERDVVYVVSDMEYTGVRINVELMAQTKPYLQKLLVPIEEKLNALTNYLDFNSPKKLQKFLFIDKGVEPQPGWLTAGGIKKKKLRLKKDKTPEETMNYQAGKYDETVYDFSVGVDTLSELMLRDDDVAEISELILEHRKYSKLISTFIDGFIPKLEKGRIHGRLLPFGTDSGRFSSKNPNLQNIAAKDFDKEGGSIRAFFIPSEGRKFITADYSQIELKMAGMTSQDPVIVSAYQRGEDMHTITAKEFGIERKPSKTVNFGILYGMQAPTLQKAIKKAQKGDKKDGVEAVGFSLQECEVFIEKYWKTYLKVKGMFDYCTEQIKKVGYIRTISGRKRRCYDISDGILKGLLNTVIQGSAGELMKVALVRLWKNMDRNRAAIVLTVHDELTVEADEDYVEECSKIVTWAMEDIIKNFKFKFTTEMNTGYSWAESK